MTHTAIRIARPASNAFAGGYGCNDLSGMLRLAIRSPLRTKSMASPKEALAERVNNIDMVHFIDVIILSLSAEKPVDARASRVRTVVMDSIEPQLWSCTASGCSANVKPVVCR
jgi:hypothetical protein